jgi:hypothetical protein
MQRLGEGHRGGAAGGAVSKKRKPQTIRKAPALVEAVSTPTIKLDLGCGQNPKEGFEGVDIRGGKAKHVCDLFKFPWPFQDSSVDEVHCSHFLEHVPAREIEERDFAPVRDFTTKEPKPLLPPSEQFIGQDMLFAVMDECYRILKPEGWMEIIVPSGRSNRAFMDPTHRRFFMQETFCYFARDWRLAQGLDHYRIACNFVGDVGMSMPQEEGLKAAPVQAERMRTLWNVTVDWWAKLRKLP